MKKDKDQLFSNISLKVLAFIIAIVLWLLAKGHIIAAR